MNEPIEYSRVLFLCFLSRCPLFCPSVSSIAIVFSPDKAAENVSNKSGLCLQLERLEKTIQEFSREDSSLDNDVKDAESLIRSLNDECDRLDREGGEQRRAVEEAEERRKDAEERLLHLREKYEEEKRIAQNTLSELRSLESSTAEDIEMTKKQVENAADRYSRLSEELTELRSQLSKGNAELTLMEAERGDKKSLRAVISTILPSPLFLSLFLPFFLLSLLCCWDLFFVLSSFPYSSLSTEKLHHDRRKQRLKEDQLRDREEMSDEASVSLSQQSREESIETA